MIRSKRPEINFDFCICIQFNLCYGVYIPVEKAVEMPLTRLEVVCVTGLPARTARPFVPSFFAFKRAVMRASGEQMAGRVERFRLWGCGPSSGNLSIRRGTEEPNMP
jgi:hypothetical protein